MRRPNGGVDRLQMGRRQRSARVRCRQDLVQVLAQPAHALRDPRVCARLELPQASDNGWLEELSQLGEIDDVAIGREVLDGPGEGPLVQRVHEVEGGVAPAPLEPLRFSPHVSCLTPGCWDIVTSKLNQEGYAGPELSMTPAATLEPGTSAYARGALYGLAAVSIWAGNIVVAGLALRSSLTPWDISAIRFGVAGVLLAP